MSSRMFSETNDSRRHETQEPWLRDIRDFGRTQGGPEHSSVLDQFLDAWEDMYTRPPSSGRTPDPKQNWNSSFLSESPRHCLYLHSPSTLNKLYSHFILAHMWFLSCALPKTLLAGSVGLPVGPQTRPACISVALWNASSEALSVHKIISDVRLRRELSKKSRKTALLSQVLTKAPIVVDSLLLSLSNVFFFFFLVQNAKGSHLGVWPNVPDSCLP